MLQYPLMAENFFSLGALRDWFLQLVLLAPAVLIAVTFHEFAHGAVANALGDPTAKERGRLTLNPLKHLDPLGTILFVLVRFGWGKPVPVDGRNFEHPRRDMALVSLAGPATNFVLAAFLGLFLKFHLVGDVAAAFVWFTVQINIVLGVFNLIPIPPLDGSRLLSAVLPVSLLRRYEAVEGYGIAIMFAVIFFFPGSLSRLISPFIEFFNRLFLV